MLHTNLVLIEGIPGSGKSTTAQQLYFHLDKLGYNARWVFEKETPHPIYFELDVKNAAQFGVTQLNRTRERVLSNWEKLAASLAGTNQVLILDSSFLQTPVGGQLLMNVPPEEILADVFRVERAIEKLNPVLIYFYQEDVGTALSRISSQRGPWFASYLIELFNASPYGRAKHVQKYEDVIEAIQASRQFMDSIFENLRLRKLAIENSAGDWKQYRNAITDLLSLPPIEISSVPIANAGKIAAKYRRADRSEEFVIDFDETGLFFESESKWRLIPRTESTFYTEAMCIELKFNTDEYGVARTVELSGPLPTLPQIWNRVDPCAAQ